MVQVDNRACARAVLLQIRTRRIDDALKCSDNLQIPGYRRWVEKNDGLTESASI